MLTIDISVAAQVEQNVEFIWLVALRHQKRLGQRELHHDLSRIGVCDSPICKIVTDCICLIGLQRQSEQTLASQFFNRRSLVFDRLCVRLFLAQTPFVEDPRKVAWKNHFFCKAQVKFALIRNSLGPNFRRYHTIFQ